MTMELFKPGVDFFESANSPSWTSRLVLKAEHSSTSKFNFGTSGTLKSARFTIGRGYTVAS